MRDKKNRDEIEAEAVSHNECLASNYLNENGIDVDSFVSRGLDELQEIENKYQVYIDKDWVPFSWQSSTPLTEKAMLVNQLRFLCKSNIYQVRGRTVTTEKEYYYYGHCS